MSIKVPMGIDIGGTAIKYGIFSDKGEILYQNSTDTPARAPKQEILEVLAGIIRQNLNYARGNGYDICAIGIGTPGSVDIHRGFLIGSTPNFEHWKNVAISDFLVEKFQIPVFADNDANLMALGEFIFGAGRGKKNVICLTLGTGIGGGIIINGELYRGHYFSGSEIGHMTIDYRGRKCNCGGTGCWERYASATALIQDYNKAKPDDPISNSKQIFDKSTAGDQTARRLLDHYIDYLSAGLSSVVNIFNPEKIILGGGVSNAGEDFIQQIIDATKQRAMPSSMAGVAIVGAELGNQAGMLGAAAFALDMVAKKAHN